MCTIKGNRDVDAVRHGHGKLLAAGDRAALTPVMVPPPEEHERDRSRSTRRSWLLFAFEAFEAGGRARKRGESSHEVREQRRSDSAVPRSQDAATLRATRRRAVRDSRA